MNKNEYKDNYIIVLKAIKNAEGFGQNRVGLYLTENNGLLNISFLEIKDILTSMENEELIKIIHYPRMSVLLYDNKPINKTELPGMLQTLLYVQDKKPRNCYEIQINKHLFGYVYYTYLVQASLASIFTPTELNNRKYKTLRKLAELLSNAGDKGVESYVIAACIKPDLNKLKKKRLIFDGYLSRKKYYDNCIKNRLKTLRRKLEINGFTVKFEEKNSVLKIVEV